MRKTTADVSLPAHPTLRHPRTGEPLRAVGWGRRGPIWPVLGGDGTNDGGQQQGGAGGQQIVPPVVPGQQTGQQQGSGQQQGQQGGQGQQQQDPYADLFNNARNQGGQQQGQQGQQQGGQGGGQQLPDNLADVIGRAVESAVDRRINAINNPNGGRNRNQGQQGQGDGGQGQEQGQQQQVARVDMGDRREARMAFREYLGDQIRFLSDTERNAAVQIGTAMIATWDGHHDGGPDGFGHQVAAAVAQTIRDLGEMYKRTAIDALRKQGLLKEQPQGPGAGSGFAATSVPNGAGSGFVLPSITGGANVAQKDPQRALNGALAAAAAYNQQAGHAPAGQQQQTS